MEFKVKISTEGLAKAPEKAKQEIWRQIEADMGLAVQQTIQAVKDRTPIGATGMLSKSITGRVQRSPNRVLAEVFPTVPYATAAEFGTRPHWVPIDPLKYWVKRKLMLPEGVAYAIQKRIAGVVKGKPGGTSWYARFMKSRHGAWGFEMFKRGFEEIKDKVPRLIESGIRKILARYL